MQQSTRNLQYLSLAISPILTILNYALKKNDVAAL